MKMTLTEAVEKLRELIPDEDAVVIDDGAQNAQPHSFCISGYQAIEKIATPGSKTSSRVYVPRAWEGRRVIVVLLDPLDE